MMLLLLLCAFIHLSPFVIPHTRIYSIFLNFAILADMLMQEHRGRLVLALAIPTLLCAELAC